MAAVGSHGSQAGAGVGAPPAGARPRVLAIAVAAQLGAAILGPIGPAAGFVLARGATGRAVAADPKHAYFIEGYGAVAAFNAGVSALLLAWWGIAVAVAAILYWRQRWTLGPMSALGVWLIVGVTGYAFCAAPPGPGYADAGDPDGKSFVLALLPEWYLPTITTLCVAVGALALVNTVAVGWLRSRR